MLRYELDRLGWFEFEGLIQALLKHQLGLGIEAWGRSGDWGRDAFFRGTLKYPSNVATSGAFLFQCKFVDGANAAGANPKPAVHKAVNEESKLIPARLAIWNGQPAHYALFTNAPLSPKDRSKITSTITTALPATEVHVHDGQDVCGWLDTAAPIARSYPQLLGLRDLESLLSGWATKEIFQRSEIAIADAQALSNVFVPTAPYSRALETLSAHKFAVLEGPPEMGKTAIARMIGLAYLARGWEIVECRTPEDFLKKFEKSRPQVFIADDFFGRTEYDPSRVSKWQDDLPYVLKRLDAEHLFILTTRAHLLNLARRKLDISGYDGRFPDLGEVVVDAGRLTTLDKARMLYRHCKAAPLAHQTKMVVKKLAHGIVANSHFTPERIRRLVHDVLQHGDSIDAEEIRRRAGQTLGDPTQAMAVSFAALPEPHKWMLFSLLEADFAPVRYLDNPKDDSLADLEARFVRVCPETDRLPVGAVAAELSEAFVRRPNSAARRGDLDWIHPSVRDLAIEQLSAIPKYRKAFLRACGREGLRLACSIGGGRHGQVSLPLLVDEDDWELFEKRLKTVMATAPDFIGVLSGTIQTAKDKEGLEDRVKRLQKILYETALPEYVLGKGPPDSWDVEDIMEFCEIFDEKSTHKVFAGLVHRWKHLVQSELTDIEKNSPTDEVDWVVPLLRAGEALIEKSAFAEASDIGEGMSELIENLAKRFAFEYRHLEYEEELSDWDSEMYSISEFMDYLKILRRSEFLPDEFHSLAAVNLSSLGDINEAMERLNKPPPSTNETGAVQRPDEIGIDRLFEDL
jgi:hypothetical protein